MRYEVNGKLFEEVEKAKEYEARLKEEKKEKEKLKKEKEEKFKEFEKIEKDYIKLANELYKKYGEVKINLQGLPMYNKSFWFGGDFFGL